MTQLGLDLKNPNPPKLYRLVLDGRFVLETDDKAAVWKRIGQGSLGSCHTVYKPDGKVDPDFIPY